MEGVLLGLSIGSLVLVLGIPVIILLVTRAADRKRRERLQVEIRQYGWQYVPEGDPRIQDRYHGRPFTPSARGRIQDVVTGRHRGRDFHAFQYRYTTTRGYGTAVTQSTHYYVHAAVPLPAAVPWLEIQRRSLGSKIVEALSQQVFHLGVPAFDERYTVLAAHPGFADAVLRSGLAAWLTRLPYGSPLIFDGVEPRTWAVGKLEPQKVLRFVDYLYAALEQVPASVWRVPPRSM